MESFLYNLKELIIKAGDIALKKRRSGVFVYSKEDYSPVTNADKEISDSIYEGLKNISPDISVICEERENEPLKESSFWLVDPIDGTKSYIKGEETYTVNIALIENFFPTIGLIYLPSQNKLYYTGADGKLKIEQNGLPVEVDRSEAPEMRALVSYDRLNAETKDFLKDNNFDNFLPLSSSLKLCLIAEGLADIYPKFSQTMEWDIAAGHALLLAAGGDISDIFGKRILYGKPGFLNPDFIAYGHRIDIDAIRKPIASKMRANITQNPIN